MTPRGFVRVTADGDVPPARRCALLRGVALVLALGALAACSDPPAAPPPVAAPLAAADVPQPDGWDADVAIAAAPDLDPDPNVVEVELEARVADVEFVAGTKTAAWTYNGTVPGPMIRARVGQRVVVRFKNSLPEPTTIHWHGVRVPNAMDGAPGMTQPAVVPGAEFRYEFTVTDAGTYWYHPHLDSSAQVGRGLYGPIVVTDPNDSLAFGDDLVLMISDVSLDTDGSLLPADNGGQFGDLFGREGATLLVNGKAVPHLKMRSGKPQRWRVINAARARYVRIRSRDVSFTLLGGDNGLAARSSTPNSVVVTPGERADLVATSVDPPGVSRRMDWLAPDRGYGTQTGRPTEQMLWLDTVDLPAVVPPAVPTELRAIESLDVAGLPERRIELTIGLDNGRMAMGMNGVPSWRAKAIEAHVGETQVWKIVNATDFAHPFHLHGFFFQVLDDARVPEWKDTVNVPSKSELRLAIRFDDRPGMWMYHCHILDHAEVGMMGHLHVLPAPVAAGG